MSNTFLTSSELAWTSVLNPHYHTSKTAFYFTFLWKYLHSVVFQQLPIVTRSKDLHFRVSKRISISHSRLITRAAFISLEKWEEWWGETTSTAVHITAWVSEALRLRGNVKRGIWKQWLEEGIKTGSWDTCQTANRVNTFWKVSQLTSDWFTSPPLALFIYVADGSHKFHCRPHCYKPNTISQPGC